MSLDSDDVQRWVHERVARTKRVLGLYVEAIHSGENLVVEPGTDMHNVSVVWKIRKKFKNAKISSIFTHFLQTMILEIAMTDAGSRNKRSHQNTCQMGGNDTKCCLYDLMIDFEKVGWNFVIAPKRYNAYVCNGECSPNQVSVVVWGKLCLGRKNSQKTTLRFLSQLFFG